ncbi:uncharacterized protein [Primulina huaijiensis]|uniref:uncharacterized protein isoform X2 n=1 Tax=Primulina huaijiensis TaxID=1492673 RepID=UPI003CC74072
METPPENRTAQSEPQIVDVRSVVEAISAEDSDAPLYEVESLCMRCGDNGITRFLLTLIPHFRKILLSAFECTHCGERNNEVQFAGEIQPNGCQYRLEVPSGDKKMFNRQVVKSETATIKIPELDFEIPTEAQRGSLSTVEGILVRAADELEALQDERKKVDPQTAEAIDEFLIKLRACATGDSHFTFILDDPSGNSFIENPYAPSPDQLLMIKSYERTPEQHAALGYLVEPSQVGEPYAEPTTDGTTGIPQIQSEPHGSVGAKAGRKAIAQGNSVECVDALFRYSSPEEVMTFPSTCGICATKSECRMFVTNIPYFREVIVMASSCDGCGYRNSEVKPGGPISDKGKRIAVHVKNVRDLCRDVIKVRNFGLERVHGFTFGDSVDYTEKVKWQEFRAKLEKLKSLEEPWTLIIDDALANSFVAPATDELKDDNQLILEEYERSSEQNEELGLNDMDTSSADVYVDAK